MVRDVQPVGALPLVFPERGRDPADLSAAMEGARRADADWRSGRTSTQVYYAGDDVLRVSQEAYRAFFSENGLRSDVFPSITRFESEVVEMTASLLHAPEVAGSITSGGTESNLLAVKTARDHARVARPDVRTPSMVIPRTAHPSFDKAGRYLGVAVTRTPIREDFQADPSGLERAITDDTILVVGSAPAYPYGVVDPIPDIADIARDRGIHCHVDACLGGFFLPFLEALGRSTPPFDFRIPGVTSISADLHKYGYTAKGASAILYRTSDLLEHQQFEFRQWPMGLYRTPTMAGTRPGGAIAAAWAVINYLGREGYARLTEDVMRVTERMIDGISRIPGLEVWGTPDMGVFAYGSREVDIYAVADGLAARGWSVRRQLEPPSIHFVVTPAHAKALDAYLSDLSEVVEGVRRGEITRTTFEITY